MTLYKKNNDNAAEDKSQAVQDGRRGVVLQATWKEDEGGIKI
jgi:hypothetical protein